MSDNLNGVKGFHARMFLAWTLWQAKHNRRLTQTELAERVERLSGGSVAQNTVSGWFNKAIPDLVMIPHIARALEVDECWLGFGKGQGPGDPVRERTLPLTPRKKRA